LANKIAHPMKKILIFGLLLAFAACQPDSKTESQQKAALELQQGQPDTPQPQKKVSENSSTPQSSTAAEKEEVQIGTRAAYQPPKSDDVLILSATSTTIKAGETGCIDVKAQRFNKLLSMQYTMAWDAKVLKFNSVKNFGLPYMNQQNFAGNRLLEGLLPFVWIDNQLKGTTLPDNSTIFTICFDGIGQAGQSSAFSFVEKPTPFEVVNLQEEVQGLEVSAGKITLE
jgi:hypothetical protein